MCSQRHQRLVEELRKVLKGAQAGDRLDSMGAIATQYGVGINTVRMAMMTLQNEGWVRLVHGSGCYVSRPPQDNTRRVIALLSDYNLLLTPNGSCFHARLMHELRLYFNTNDCSARFYIGQVGSEASAGEELTCAEFLEDLELNQISGVVATSTRPMMSWLKPIHAKGIPVVGMGGWNKNFTGIVDPDVCGAIRNAVVQFVGNGRSRPAYIGWEKSSIAAFSAVLEEVGLRPNPRWTKAGLAPIDPGAGWSDFREIWAGSGEKPDCVIFGDDILFRDAVPAIEASGVHVPSELEVVVLSNAGASLPQPFPYTRMDCDPAELAGAMGALLLQDLAGESPAHRYIAIPYRATAQEENDAGVDYPIVAKGRS
jgi:DNA-binding LacI/PurR family transcriptional regulator